MRAIGRPRGVTLVEIVIVVTVVSILAAVGMGAIQQTMSQAKVTSDAETFINMVRGARRIAKSGCISILVFQGPDAGPMISGPSRFQGQPLQGTVSLYRPAACTDPNPTLLLNSAASLVLVERSAVHWGRAAKWSCSATQTLGGVQLVGLPAAQGNCGLNGAAVDGNFELLFVPGPDRGRLNVLASTYDGSNFVPLFTSYTRLYMGFETKEGGPASKFDVPIGFGAAEPVSY